jgi:hypothetical protein
VTPIQGWRVRACVLAFATTIVLGPSASSALGSNVEPETYSNTLQPGSSVTITKTVNTPAIPTNPDIVFMSDTTGSMGPSIANVQGNVASIMEKVNEGQPSGAKAEFAAANYKDGRPATAEEEGCPSDPYAFKVDQGLTETTSEVQTAVNGWSAEGGCDTPESQVNALFEVGSGAISFRSNSTRVLVWFGDSSGHDPDLGHTLTEAIAALQAEHVRVIAVPINSGGGDGLDSTGQATKVAEETGGEVLPEATPEEVSKRILEGLENLPVTVTPAPACDPGLTATYDAPSKTVTSGTPATFEETLSVESSVPAGTVLHCKVPFLLDGVEQPGFVQTVEIITGCTRAHGVGHAGPRNPEGLNEDNNLNTELTGKEEFEFTLPSKAAHFHLSHLNSATCLAVPGGFVFSGQGTGKVNHVTGYEISFSIEETEGHIYLTVDVEKEGVPAIIITHLLLNKGSKEHYS